MREKNVLRLPTHTNFLLMENDNQTSDSPDLQ